MPERDLEQQILTLVKSSMEDTRIPDAIAAYADKRAGKPVTKTDAAKLETQLGVPVRIRRQYGMTHVTWTPSPIFPRDEHSILLAHSETNVSWPSAADLRAKEPAYAARDDRNAARRKLLNEWQLLRGALHANQTSIVRAAATLIKLREAQAELLELIDYGQPLHVAQCDIEKLAEKA